MFWLFDTFPLYCICRWMNGQHLRSLPSEELIQIIGSRWKDAGILTESGGNFIQVGFVREIQCPCSICFFKKRKKENVFQGKAFPQLFGLYY